MPSSPPHPRRSAEDDAVSGVLTVDGLRAACAFCGVRSAFVSALEAELPLMRGEPWRVHLAELHRRVFVTREMDGAALAAWSPASAPPLFPVFLFLSAAASARADHAARDIPERVSRATFADLDLWIEAHRVRHGAPGLREIAWLHNHFTGRLLALGRLQYRFETFPAEFVPLVPDGAAPGPESPVLSVHIPASGPLAPEDCARSFAEAAGFFPRHYPDRAVRGLVCYSWLLDPALADYLPAQSNIVSFQRRFDVFALPVADDAPFRALFPEAWSDPRSAQPRTALQSALRDHLLAGHRWAVHGGVLREHSLSA